MPVYLEKHSILHLAKLAALAASSVVMLAACDFDDGPLEEAGAELDTTLESSQEQIDSAMDDMSEGLQDFKATTHEVIDEASTELEAMSSKASDVAKEAESSAAAQLQ